MKHCHCLFCRNPRALLIEQADDELLHVVLDKRDEDHAIFRVAAYIELYYRCGIFDQDMPYRVWNAVMGDAPPPFSWQGGAFRRLQPSHTRPLCFPLN
jgi:hypothetical protein